MGRGGGEFERRDKAGLLVQAVEAAGGVDDLVFSLEGFASRRLNAEAPIQSLCQ